MEGNFFLKMLNNSRMAGTTTFFRRDVQRWIEEEAGQIRKKYFTGKFLVGKGQAD